MNAELHLTENFCCAKCRGRVPTVRSVVFRPENFWSVFTGTKLPRYYLVTCGLCGYTELYDARVYALQNDVVTAQAPLPQKT